MFLLISFHQLSHRILMNPESTSMHHIQQRWWIQDHPEAHITPNITNSLLACERLYKRLLCSIEGA